MSRRVAVLSPGNEFVADLLPILAARGIRVDAIVLYVPSVAREWRKARGMRRALGLPLVPLRWLSRRVKRRLHPPPANGAAPMVFTGTLNGRRMARDLRRLDPDVLVLARCGLVAPEILSIPREGVVNVHPGLLPWIRGNSPLGNSLLRGVPLGVTAFRVDAGIDTGPILSRRLVRLSGGETADALHDGLYRLWLEMTADALAAAAAGPLPSGHAQAGRFPICHTLAGPARLAEVDGAVRRGEAKALFDRWRRLCDPSTLALAPDTDVPFMSHTGT